MEVGRYTYDDVRVVFRAAQRSGTYRVTAIDLSAGTTVEGSFVSPLDGDDVMRGIAPRLATTREVAPADHVDVRSPAEVAEGIGARLAHALLTGPVGELYATAVERVGSSVDRGVRLSLSLGEAPQLLGVPWELLFVAPRFLASQRRTPVVRLLEMNRTALPAPVAGPLSLLCVVSSPADLPRLDVDAERRRIEQALTTVREQRLVDVTWLHPATPDTLRTTLLDGAYHVIHFVGHSDFTAAGDGVVFLENDAGGAVPLESTLLANLIADQSATLRLVVLNSCKGARTTADDPAAGVAATLISLGLPAVVAMQFPISDDAAIVFAEALYATLIARRQPVDAAVGEARKAISATIPGAEWATPVLFLRDPLANLFDFVSGPSEERGLDTRPTVTVTDSGPVAIGGNVTISGGVAGGRDVRIGRSGHEGGHDG
jgi:hypothetical protein